MKKVIFSGSWKNREDDLSQLKRYHKFDVMFYRTDLAIHSKRVEALLRKLVPIINFYYPNLDIKKALLISKYHDDYELVLKGGDISLQTKLQMNDEQHADLNRKEKIAAEKIAKYYPKKIKGYKYLDILFHAINKDCPEAQLHSFIDKIDGYCEALHEVLAGNLIFLEPVINYQAKSFNNLKENFFLIKNLFNQKDSHLFNFPVIDLIEFFQKGNIGAKPHTVESIARKSFIPHYEEWKRVTLETFPNAVELLTKQLEFHRE